MHSSVPGNYQDNFENNLLLQDLFVAQKNQTPDAVAIRFQDVSVTYLELDKKSDALAKEILHQSPDSAIAGISTTRCIEMVIGVLAILKSGKAYLPIDPTYPVERLQQIV